mgnify:CR=1 FL=1
MNVFPLTVLFFGISSRINIDKDCNDILNIFGKAFAPLRFETIKAYSYSFQRAIAYLEQIGKKILENDREENK